MHKWLKKRIMTERMKKVKQERKDKDGKGKDWGTGSVNRGFCWEKRRD